MYDGEPLDLVEKLRKEANKPINLEDTDDWMVLPARVICGYTREMTYMQQEENLRNCLRIVVEENAGRKS